MEVWTPFWNTRRLMIFFITYVLPDSASLGVFSPITNKVFCTICLICVQKIKLEIQITRNLCTWEGLSPSPILLNFWSNLPLKHASIILQHTLIFKIILIIIILFSAPFPFVIFTTSRYCPQWLLVSNKNNSIYHPSFYLNTEVSRFKYKLKILNSFPKLVNQKMKEFK